MYRFKENASFKLIFLVLFFLLGCPSVRKDLQHKINYKKTLRFHINDKVYVGLSLPPIRKSYSIMVTAPFNLDFLKIETCHREIVLEKAFYRKRILKDKKKYKFFYTPTEIEKDCPLFITALSQKGVYSFGEVILNHPEYSMQALNYCNGEVYESEGVSICQSKKGLTQLIEFGKKVIVQSNCSVITLKGGRKFKYEVGSGDCVFLFFSIDKKNKIHKLITFGYEEIILERK